MSRIKKTGHLDILVGLIPYAQAFKKLEAPQIHTMTLDGLAREWNMFSEARLQDSIRRNEVSSQYNAIKEGVLRNPHNAHQKRLGYQLAFNRSKLVYSLTCSEVTLVLNTGVRKDSVCAMDLPV